MRRSTAAALTVLASLAACADAPTLPSLPPTVVGARGGASAAASPLVLGLTRDNQIIGFDAAKPNQVLSTVAVSGLLPGEWLVGIDFRPSNVPGSAPGSIGRLYGVGSAGNIYTIDAATGAATSRTPLVVSVGGPAVALVGSSFGVGFNPVPDRLRIHSDAGQNLRVNVDNGVTSAVVGPLGVDTDAAVGFDAAFPGNTAYAALSESASGKSTLFTIDLATGAATKLGLVAQSSSPLVGIAVQP